MSADPIITSWQSLLDALEVDNAKGVSDVIYEYAEGDGWLDTEHFDTETSVTPAVNNRGTNLEYPFRLSEFWQVIDDLNREIDAEDDLDDSDAE